ncbi:MAG: hypothetical protein AB7P49_09760 [Bdellovibrionales bacterium]
MWKLFALLIPLLTQFTPHLAYAAPRTENWLDRYSKCDLELEKIVHAGVDKGIFSNRVSIAPGIHEKSSGVWLITDGMGRFVPLKSGKNAKDSSNGDGVEKSRGVKVKFWGLDVYISLVLKGKDDRFDTEGPPYLIKMSMIPLEDHDYESGTMSSPLLIPEVGEALVRKNRAMVESLRQAVPDRTPLQNLEKGPYFHREDNHPPRKINTSFNTTKGFQFETPMPDSTVHHFVGTPEEKNQLVREVLGRCLEIIQLKDDSKYKLRDTINEKIKELNFPLPEPNRDGSQPGRTAT